MCGVGDSHARAWLAGMQGTGGEGRAAGRSDSAEKSKGVIGEGGLESGVGLEWSQGASGV